MKKSLFALAALGAFATAAQAQSSVTLYGTLDSGIAMGQNVGQANGVTTTPVSTSTPTTAGGTALVDSQISSSSWGLRGTEDLGGGLTANFNLEGDATTYNGATDTRGIFRRGAWVGISGAFGQTKVGLQGNPMVATSAALLPVMGNVVNQQRTAVGYSLGVDNVKNAIGYVTPTINGFTASAVYGFSNTVDDQTGGSMFAANANFVTGNLRVQAAYQKANAGTGATYLNSVSGATTQNVIQTTGKCSGVIAATPAVTVTCVAANSSVSGTAVGGNTAYIAGLRYKVTPTLEIGYGFNKNDYAVEASTATGNFNMTGHMFGVGYNATSTLLLGASYLTNSTGSNMTNLQARYSLSKRTTLYSMASLVSNSNGSSSSNSAIGNYSAIQTSTNKGQAVNFYNMAALPNTNSQGYSVGIIHSF